MKMLIYANKRCIKRLKKTMTMGKRAHPVELNEEEPLSSRPGGGSYRVNVLGLRGVRTHRGNVPGAGRSLFPPISCLSK